MSFQVAFFHNFKDKYFHLNSQHRPDITERNKIGATNKVEAR